MPIGIPHDVLGKKYNMLTVVGPGLKGKGRCRWQCLCDCGKESFVSAHQLVSGKTKSCGCIRFRKAEKNHRWRGCGELTGTYWAIVTHNAKCRGFEVSVTIEDAWQQYLLQNRRCASLDRIDSKLGYVQGNIQWVDKRLNLMKLEHSQSEFIRLCRAVVEFADQSAGVDF